MGKCRWSIFCVLFFTSLTAIEDIEQLNVYLRSRGFKRFEGNICSRNTSQPEFFEELLLDNPWLKSVGEIGFNAGHSSVFFLSLGDDSTVYSFDIMMYRYCKVAKQFIDMKYPGRHTLIKGNSMKTVKAFPQNYPEVKFDLIFIDGGHSFNLAYADMRNMSKMAHKNTIVIIDDMHKDQSVYNAFIKCKEEGLFIDEEFFSHERGKNWVKCKYNVNTSI